MWCQNVKVNKRINTNIDQSQRKKILKQIDMYGNRLEGKQHQNKFLHEPEQTELVKKYDVNVMHTNTCVTFDMSFATPQPNSSALLFLKNSSIGHSIYCPPVTIV